MAQTTAKPDASRVLTFLATGTVQIRVSMKNQPATNRSVTLRRLRSFLDPNWSEDLPIGVFVISHSDGPILFDTGESPCCNDPGFKSFYSPTKFFTRTKIGTEDGIVEQLRKISINPQDLQAVVLSHLHGDHAGGLEELYKVAPNVPILISEEHWKAFGNSPVFATLGGCNPSHWPSPFNPSLIQQEPHAIGPWKKSYKITSDGSIWAVSTPGHVPGHISLVVFDDKEDGTSNTFFLPGDATYGLDLLDTEEPDGVNDDPEAALQTLKHIKEFARQTPLIVLPSHDPKTPKYLAENFVYRPRD